jgi:hypothetical protein
VRDAARAFLRRHAELAAALALGAGALALLGRPALSGAPVALGLLLPALALAGWLGWDGLTRSRLMRRRGPGIVTVREGRILYMGPQEGGVVDLDALARVAITYDKAGPTWHLTALDGTALAIPAGAEGAAALPDALAALPGFSLAAAFRAPAAGGVTLYRRDRAAEPAPTTNALSGPRR